ncbi:MAG TPA: CoA-transferase [Thermodesulfobacteriota bacterium]|nr:CoA-transferase [Thermodesulfobacteriota bacterium]
MNTGENKVMSAREAVAKFVNDGDTLIIGNYTICIAFGLVNEVARQKKKGLTLCSQSGHLCDEILTAAGCVDKLVTAYVMNAGTQEGEYPVSRGLKRGTLQVEDYTNFEYNARLVAGMHGFSFMPVLEGILHTDVFRKRSFMGENKFQVITCPFTGRETVLVPALNPDVCIVHVQRADRFGNAQYWGAMGSVQAAALASNRIIVSCEEIVEHDVIASSPHFTIIPAFRVNAVVEMPWGAHPSPVVGYYNSDRAGMGFLATGLMNQDGGKAILDEWVYGCQDHYDYLKRYLSLLGPEYLNNLRARPFYSAPANYGAAYTSVWDEDGRERTMGITLTELEQIMREKGVLYE